MSLINSLSSEELWESFYKYKTSLCCPAEHANELREFIDRRDYLPIMENILAGKPFPLPRKVVISKLASSKKRIVYTYPPKENLVLKFLTWMLLRTYDGLFEDRLYSFRPGKTAKEAVHTLLSVPGISGMYACKEDLSNYFNSIPVDRMTELLRSVLGEDEPLLSFLTSLLTEPRVLENGKEITEPKGIMAGTPLSAFYANLYLMDLDHRFASQKIPYARYSDDIIFFAPTKSELDSHIIFLKDFIAEKGLTINPDKEMIICPGEAFVFLGFEISNGTIDLSPVSVRKMKGKMRRKTRSLLRWSRANGLSGEKAAKAFIKIFRRKLFENGGDHDLTWSRWFFPVITTDKSLKELDHYAQDCIRVLASGGKHTKARYRTRYEDLKELGYISLVHEYYREKDK